jgi:hypothetical protein
MHEKCSNFFSTTPRRLPQILDRNCVVTAETFPGLMAGDGHDHPIRDSLSSQVGHEAVADIMKMESPDF